ncbi:MAG: ThuA domain-containing protein, partial [Butyrivibrio sp.]|nr:ThuA domain-containing protein [Butyrivibrio sp.]
LLQETDVLIWWSHARQEEVTDETVRLVKEAVLAGMGLIALHSAHYSKVLRALLGTTMTLHWRHGDREKLWCVAPSHPIAQGIPACVDIPEEEMYGEHFDIPKPDDIIFIGWFAGGEVFRSGVTFTRGLGKIFYFQPGHEEAPVYEHPDIQKIIANAVRWALPLARNDQPAQNIEAVWHTPLQSNR